MYLCISTHEVKHSTEPWNKNTVQVVRMSSKMLPDRPLQELAVLQTATPLCHGKESKNQPKRRQRDFFGTREPPKPKTVAGPCDDPF